MSTHAVTQRHRPFGIRDDQLGSALLSGARTLRSDVVPLKQPAELRAVNSKSSRRCRDVPLVLTQRVENPCSLGYLFSAERWLAVCRTRSRVGKGSASIRTQVVVVDSLAAEAQHRLSSGANLG